MKKLLGILAVVLITTFSGYEASASHYSGGNISYKYLGPGPSAGTFRYRISLSIYRDCNGALHNTNSERISAFCPGNAVIALTANKINYVAKPGEKPANQGRKDVSDICRGIASRCAGTSNPGGYEASIYEVDVTLPQCNYWEFYYQATPCCRNNMINNSGSTFGTVTRLNSLDFPTNSSPSFDDKIKPMPTVCVGQNVFYGLGLTDVDKDSLRFFFNCPINRVNSAGNYTYAAYRSGYSCTAPISGVVLDSASGLITFRPTIAGRFLLSFWVVEYERCTGREKGRTHREVQFDSRACSASNTPPRDISGISNVIGNAKRLGRWSLEMCEGDVVQWEDTLADPNSNDSIYVLTNVDSVLTGVTWSIIPTGKKNVSVIRWRWRAKLDAGQYLTYFISFDDNFCPFPGNGIGQFEIYVRPAASAGPDQTVCKGDTAFIDALGGTSFRWHHISGDPMITGVNWFPDTTLKDTNRTVKFMPTRTTSIWVEVDTLRNACGAKVVANCFTTDTITIFVPDSFGIRTVPDRFLCNPGSGQLDVSPSRNFKYTYKWAPAGFLDTASKKDPTFRNVKYPTTFKVTVTSDSGCVREDEVNVNVTDPFPTNMKIKATDTLICVSKTIGLWVDEGQIDYGKLCDTASYNCQGTFKNFILGAGLQSNSTTSNNFPLAYGSDHFSGKSQYLYRGTELKAMGMKPGPIQSIAWEIKGLYAGLGTPFNDFTIRMRCTSATDLVQGSFAVPGGIVYGPKSYIPSVGWNDHVLDREYNWDGVSNLLVEVCWENSAGYNGSHIQSFDNKGYAASSYYYQLNTFSYAPACGQTTPSGGFPQNVLPRTRFNSCVGARSSLFKYDWEPKANGGFIGATNKDTVSVGANLATAKWYTVYVEDSMFGVCKDTLSIKINVVSQYDVKPDSLGEQCVTNGYIQLKSPTPWKISNPGGRWSGVGIINDTLGIWDPTKSGFGQFWVKYQVTGNACANKDSTLIDIVGLPDVSIVSPDSGCVYYGGTVDTVSHRLVGRIPGGIFSGKGVDSTLNKNGKMVYYLNGTVFSPKAGKPDTAYVKHRLFKGCWHDTIIKIPIVAAWDSTFMGILFDDKTFCKTSTPDTLAVRGPRPIWKSLKNPSAMIDTLRGVYNPRFARPGLDSILVYSNAFCGTSNKFEIFIQDTVEIEIQEKQYCFANGCFGIPLAEREDTILIRLPKGPGMGGLTNKLDTNGFDPTKEVLVYRGLSSNSGWLKVNDHEDFNKWGGTLGTTPQVARFKPCTKDEGTYVVKYSFPLVYRNNHPRNLCYSKDAATIVIRKPPLAPVPTKEMFAYCPSDRISGIIVDTTSIYRAGYKIEWYVDTNKSPVYVGLPLESGELNNTVGSHNVFVRYVDSVAGCSGPFTLVSYKVYGNPKAEFGFSNNSGNERIFAGEDKVTFKNVTDYSDTSVFYRWYDLKSNSGITSGDLIDRDLASNSYNESSFDTSRWYHRVRYATSDGLVWEVPCEPRDGIQRKINPEFTLVNGRMVPTKFGLSTEKDTLCAWGRTYSEFGGYGMWLVAINDIGCGDTAFHSLTIDQKVDPKFPNVFTPDGDGINDFWSIIPPVGIECPCPSTHGGANNCYCPEGEALLREMYKRDFLSIEGYIFDRWGRKVFELSLDEPIWKGQNKAGNNQVDGVYFYTMKGVLRNQSQDPLIDPATGEAPQGTITLIRGK